MAQSALPLSPEEQQADVAAMMVESLGGVFDADKLKALGDKPQMNELLGLMMDGFHEALGDLAGLGRLEDPEDDE